MFYFHQNIEEYLIKHPVTKASTEEVQYIESTLSVSLPKSYVDFITQYGYATLGSGDLYFSAFNYQILYPDRIEVREGAISFLLDEKRLVEMYNYITLPQCENDDEFPMFPRAYLPVGNSAGQDLILLKISGDQIGSVWFWQFNNSAWGTEDNTWLGYVAKDFYEFINNLRPYE